MYQRIGEDKSLFVTIRKEMNHERAVRAMRALRGHEGKSHLHGYEVEEAAIDAITDIFHLLHERGFDVEQVITTCTNHFDCERID